MFSILKLGNIEKSSRVIFWSIEAKISKAFYILLTTSKALNKSRVVLHVCHSIIGKLVNLHITYVSLIFVLSESYLIIQFSPKL